MDAFAGRTAGESTRGMRWRTPLRAAVLALLCLGLSTTTATAAAPLAFTDPATDISPVGATLHGRVDPNGQASAAWFQYGTTKSYGKSTRHQSAGLAPGQIAIADSISGLASNKTYHFRMVAESKDGRKNGPDKTFKTSKPTTTPVFTPNPVPYGKPVAVSGQIVGTGANGAEVSLLGKAFPYTDPFAKFGNTVLADSQGNYLFILASALSNSMFEVQAKTNPAFTSAPQLLHVSSTISLHTPGSIKRRHSVHFWGVVAPAQDGIVVEIQKLQKDGSWVLFTRTALQHRAAGGSRYSTRKKLYHSHTFRAVVHSNGGVVDEGTTQGAHFIRVHR
jgi:hypothetical protein